MQQFMAMNDD